MKHVLCSLVLWSAYFLGTYYFNRGRYANALAGLTHWDTKTECI